MHEGLVRATDLQKGIYYFGAGCSVSGLDAALARFESFTAAGFRGRISTLPLWDEMQCWVESRRARDPHAVYVLPEIVFSTPELLVPGVNHAILDSRELARRRGHVLMRLLLECRAFFTVCGITRPGLNFRSFRYTNIKAWQMAGVPQRLGMFAAQMRSKSAYEACGFAQPRNLKQLARFTRDFHTAAEASSAS